MDEQAVLRRDIWRLGGATVLLSVIPLTTLFAPVALGALVRRHGMKTGGITALIAGIAAAFFTMSSLMFAQTALFLALGIVIGGGLRENIPMRTLVATATVVGVVATIVLKTVVERATGMPMHELMVQFWQEVFQGTSGIGSEESHEAAMLLMARTRATFLSGLTLSSLGLAVVYLASTTKLLDRLSVLPDKTPGVGDAPTPPVPREGSVDRLPPFGKWRFHRGLSVVYVILWIIGGQTAAPPDPTMAWPWYELIIVNGLLISGTLATVHGAAVAWHYLRRTSLSTFLSVVVMGVLLLAPVATTLMLIVGLVDGWVDLRKLKEAD